ncbi:RNA dependent RNA polymerase-domain-containing protein [Mycena sp. CBHHK59/15]|nr:RNA dependent RNA polymerase-domain-containing protein [Mycena sp. CBHHK59/15]
MKSSSQGSSTELEDEDSEMWSSFGSSLQGDSEPKSEHVKNIPSTVGKRKFDASLDSPSNSVAAKRTKYASHAITKISFKSGSSVLKKGDTSPVIIATCRDSQLQAVMSDIGLPYGVSYEIARLVSMGRLEEASLNDLYKLTDILIEQNKHVASSHAAFAAERESQCPWTELDAEESAMAINPNAALGNCPDYPRGYGGKLCFGGRLEIDQNSNISVVLGRCTVGPSCRLCRFFGSSSFLRLKVPAKTLHSANSGLIEFHQRPFIVWDRVFRAFYAKEDNIFLFKTREIFRDGAVQLVESPNGLSLFEFLNQFNPLELNCNQALCKWASRFALGLSNSVPGPVLGVEDVEEIPDKISSAQSNMTDGCGLSNLEFNLKLRRDFNLDSTPCAVQIRHGGRKGMLVMRPDSAQDGTPKVWFRNPSQVKVVYSPEAQAHPANATVDILRFSRTRTPARISPEVIINLEHNGVPADVFVAMQNAYIAQGVDDLLFWAKEEGRDTPGCMTQLWSAVERAEGVCAARRVREAAGEARFRGYGGRSADMVVEEDEDEEPEVFDKAVQARSAAWWPDYISGCPSSLAETVMTLLDAGFTPQTLPVLRDKLKQIVRTKIKYRTQFFRYQVDHSASAIVVPDFLGVLGENEIHFKSSRREFLTAGGLETDIVIGDVLMTRNPCKVPTDVRKVKGVKCPELCDLVDVIVCQRRLLDYLAGGDYDGDTAIVIWDAAIVEPFTNSDEKYSIEPPGLDFCFTCDETSVAKFNADNRGESPEVKAAHLQKYLLGALRDASVVGQYSSLHDNAIVKNGYDNPRTVKLAYQFCKILDSPKTGYIIRPETREADAKRHGHARGPAWKSRQKNKPTDIHADESNSNHLQRQVSPTNPMLSRPFIMDILNDAATRQEHTWLRDAEQLFLPFETSPLIVDPHLTAPWEQYVAFAEKRARENTKDTRFRRDLGIIALHVKAMYNKHSRSIKASNKAAVLTATNSFSGRAIEVRQDTLRALSRDFAASPTPDQLTTIVDEALISRLRASYAYIFDQEQNQGHGKGWSRFPWDVALGELSRIKTTALGSHKAVTVGFYEKFKIGGGRKP